MLACFQNHESGKGLMQGDVLCLSAGQCLARYTLAGDENATCLVTVAAPTPGAAAGRDALDSTMAEYPAELGVDPAAAQGDSPEALPAGAALAEGAQPVRWLTAPSQDPSQDPS